MSDASIIKELLSKISVEASREDRAWYEKPNYGLIIEAYRDIIKLIDPSPRVKSDDDVFRIKRS